MWNLLSSRGWIKIIYKDAENEDKYNPFSSIMIAENLDNFMKILNDPNIKFINFGDIILPKYKIEKIIKVHDVGLEKNGLWWFKRNEKGEIEC